MAITATKLLTADDLLRLDSEGVRGELIRGVFHEIMSSGVEHGEIAAKLTILLGIFIMPRKLGRLGGLGRGRLVGARPGYRPRAGHRLLLGGAAATGRADYGLRRSAP